jgi:single-strand DNA-binding protein
MAHSIETALLGSVGALPTERHTQGGKRFITFTVAIKDKGGEDTEWVNVSAFEAVADHVPSDLAKGERIYVEGKARLNRWTTKEGVQRVNLQVTASKVIVLDRIGRKRRRPPQTDADTAATNGEAKAYRYQSPLTPDDGRIPF